jgi:hypothetical protein
MIQLQAIGKDGTRLKPLIRTAIQDRQIKSFQITQVKGGLRIQHAKYPGTINFSQKKNVLFATLNCRNKQKEWQLLETFIGRLTYHFKDDILAINIQFE